MIAEKNFGVCGGGVSGGGWVMALGRGRAPGDAVPRKSFRVRVVYLLVHRSQLRVEAVQCTLHYACPHDHDHERTVAGSP